MAKTAKTNPEDLVNAIRKTAKELGCNESEDRFREALLAIGTEKPVRRNGCFDKLGAIANKNRCQKLGRFPSSRFAAATKKVRRAKNPQRPLLH